MRIYKKEGNTVEILCFPSEKVEKGDYLFIEDPKANRGLVTQVVDVQFANVPGILEELLRDSTTDDYVHGGNFDPLEVSSHINHIQDALVLICKIRGAVQNGKLLVNPSWLPSRSKSKIKRLPITSLLTFVKINEDLPIDVGETKEASVLAIDARALDGKLNIVTGKKETGKSHLSKLLVLGLIDYGATVVVLDLNGEYVNLGFSSKGEKNEYYDKVHVLTSGANLKVSLAQMDLQVMLNILVHALNLPGTSTREFRRIWRFLQQRQAFTLQELGEAIRNWKCNQHVRDALFSRYYSLLNSGFFTDNLAEATTFEELFQKVQTGGALVLNLRDVSSVDRQIVVEYMLGKLVELLTEWKMRAVFLFAEEAHLYLRETYWDDIVTRMRHFGVFTTFVTNQPDTIRENIYRQADNIFLFNFTNERDLETVSRAARVDSETVKSIARDLPPHYCLILGKAVKDFPMVAKVKALDVQTMGHTRLFFTDKD
ncbi:MAG: AAA-like domain protein [Candidatus Bathyarchaeota archaeon BA2]|nr:MAG: AAA-like domain protein [Candidatus Bathyarchaeota archaeon BA2]